MRTARIIKKSAAVIGVLACALLPASFLFLPLPTDASYAHPGANHLAALYCAGMILVALIAAALLGPPVKTSRALLGATGALVAAALVLLAREQSGESYRLPVAVALMFAVAAACGGYAKLRDRIPAPAIASLLLLVCGAAALENLLQAIPERVLRQEMRHPRPPAFEDTINSVYKMAGFRGKRPCGSCPPDLVRVIALGGSSTNGIPMHFSSRTFSAELQRLLDQRRIGENYEVLNGGIGGAGIMQVYSALTEELIEPYAPDVVIVNCWFNDNSRSTGWYSQTAESDRAGYYRTRLQRRLQRIPLYSAIRRTRTFALYKHYLLSLRDQVSAGIGAKPQKSRPRMTPDEFRWALERIAALGREHDFLPVFVLEPMNRSVGLAESLDQNRYYRVITAVGAEEHIPVVDPLTDLDQRISEWLFYDFIHPNPLGHQIIAEKIYAAMFDSAAVPRLEQFWRARGIYPDKSPALPSVMLQYRKGETAGKSLAVKARAPFAGETPLQLMAQSPLRKQHRLGPLGTSFATYQLPAELLRENRPIVDIVFSAKPEAGSFAVGTTGASVPVPLVVVSGGRDFGWTARIAVAGDRYDYDYRGYNAVVIGAKSGEVRATGLFDIFEDAKRNQELHDFITAAEKYSEDGLPPVIALAVHTDGGNNADPKLLSPAFRFIGGSGDTPPPFSSFILIGTPGAAPGTALELRGERLLEARLGSDSDAAARLIEVEPLTRDGLLFTPFDFFRSTLAQTTPAGSDS